MSYLAENCKKALHLTSNMVIITSEENIRCQCQRLISSDTLERCFIPYYQQKKRFQGEWHIQERILFPGYVFLITQNLEKLVESLKKVIGMTRLLGTGEEIIPLSQEEINLLLL